MEPKLVCRGTLLGCPLSFIEMCAYVLIPIDIVNLSLPPRDHAWAQNCGDDFVAVIPENRRARLLNSYREADCLVNDKTVFCPGPKLLVKFIEEKFLLDLTVGDPKRAICYYDTVKLRFFNNQNSGPTSRRSTPLFSHVTALATRLRYMGWERKGDPDVPMWLGLVWANLPELFLLRSGYPVTLSTDVGGLGMPTSSNWKNEVSQLPNWVKAAFILTTESRGQNILAMIVKTKELGDHGGSTSLPPEIRDAIQPVTTARNWWQEQKDLGNPDLATFTIKDGTGPFSRGLDKYFKLRGVPLATGFEIQREITRISEFRSFLAQTSERKEVPVRTLDTWVKAWNHVRYHPAVNQMVRAAAPGWVESNFLRLFPGKQALDNKVAMISRDSLYSRDNPVLVDLFEGPSLRTPSIAKSDYWAHAILKEKRKKTEPSS